VSVREAAHTSDDAANSLGEKNLELAWERWRNGDLAAAEIHARQAIRFDEQDAWAYFLLGCILVEAQRPHEAEAPMTRAVRLRPTKAGFHRKLGELFHHLGLASDAMDEERRYLKSAEKCFRAAIRLNPEDAAAHCALALRLAGSMRHEEAERAYRTAVALEPEEPKYHCGLGEYLVFRGRKAEGKSSLDTALRLDLNGYRANLYMGQFFTYEGKLTQARRYLERALRAWPQSTQAREALEGLGRMPHDESD
jgi:Tfp pilus assembly protein PilF